MSKEILKDILELDKQIKESLKLAKTIKISGKVDDIMVCGMGGSGISGDVLKAIYTKKPVYIIKDYSIPDYVNGNTLAFIVSYSGNTEETLSAYNEALKRKCKIVVITSGGQLLNFAKKNKNNSVQIPSGFQPRAALIYLFFPMLNVLRNSGLIGDFNEDVADLLDVLKAKDFKKKAKELAELLVNKVPLVYSSNRFEAVSFRWKTQFNENSKVYAYHNVFSELNHNELVPYYARNRNFFVIMLEDDEDYYRIRKRMDITKHMISRTTDVVEIEIFGENMLTKIFTTIHLGDLTSYYLAVKRKVDPNQVKIIEELKKELSYTI